MLCKSPWFWSDNYEENVPHLSSVYRLCSVHRCKQFAEQARDKHCMLLITSSKTCEVCNCFSLLDKLASDVQVHPATVRAGRCAGDQPAARSRATAEPAVSAVAAGCTCSKQRVGFWRQPRGSGCRISWRQPHRPQRRSGRRLAWRRRRPRQLRRSIQRGQRRSLSEVSDDDGSSSFCDGPGLEPGDGGEADASWDSAMDTPAALKGVTGVHSPPERPQSDTAGKHHAINAYLPATHPASARRDKYSFTCATRDGIPRHRAQWHNCSLQ